MEKVTGRLAVCLALFVCSGNLFSVHSSEVSGVTFKTGVEPKVEISYDIVLSSAMSEALKKRYPDFKIWKQVNFDPEVVREYRYTDYQSPSGVFGDFNGDNIVDAVLMGYNKLPGQEWTRMEMLAIVSNTSAQKKELPAGEYKVVDIWMSESIEPSEATRGIKSVLAFHPKGEIVRGSSENACDEVLKNDAFGVKNLDMEGIETLFPCDKYMITSCLVQ